MNRRTRQSAFTLIELVLASAIIASIAAALYASVNVAFRARTAAQRQVDAMREAQILMSIVRADFESVLPPGGTLAGPFIGESIEGIGDTHADALEFHALGRDRAADDDDPLADGIRRIELQLRNDYYPPALVRRVQANLLASTEHEPEDEILATNVRSFTVRYFDGYGWAEEWDSTQQGNVLPAAVELSIELDLPAPMDPQRFYRISQVVPLSCTGGSVE